jgi:hypothetical protein
MKIKHQIIGEYATKCSFFDLKKLTIVTGSYLIMHSPERGQIYFYASSPDAAACRVCLPRKYGRFMLLIDNNLLLPGAKLHILNNIYRK